jgi:competence protein CoiA
LDGIKNVKGVQNTLTIMVSFFLKQKTMQLYALDNIVPVVALKAEKGKDYSCPECGAKVRLRGGPSRQMHFYHLSLPKNCRQHQKSLEHLQLQLKLLGVIGQDAQMEAPFLHVRRIADVAWHAQKIIFEIQCSPISLEEASKRNLDYQRAGYTVVWILHDKQFNSSNVCASENYLRTGPCYYTNIDKAAKGGIYDQFEVIRCNKRLFKGPPLHVSVSKISLIPAFPLDIPLPQIIFDRLRSWKYFAAGDLLDRLFQEKSFPLAAKKMMAIETYCKVRKRDAQMLRLPFKEWIVKAYCSLLAWALKNL